MAHTQKKGKSSVYKTLQESPGSFALSEAVGIVNELLPEAGGEAGEKRVLYRVNPNLSFPPSDIDSLVIEENKGKKRAVMVMNLMGLHGAGSPLPAYFTEYVAKNQDEQSTLQDFFDIFNNRLVELLYEAWRKYRYYIQFENSASDKLSQRFFSFIGMGHKDLRDAKKLNWAKLLAYMGLIAFKGDAAGSLESTLRYYFSHNAVGIIPCIRRRVAIPADQQCRLGKDNSTLARDLLVGETVQDQTGKFRIGINDLTWEKFTSFLPDTHIFFELTTLVHSILRSRLQFDVELRLRPDEIKPLTLGKQSVNRLGWSTWLGDGGDGIVVLQQGYKDFQP